MEPSDKSAQYTDADGTIDVKKLISAYSFDEHAQRADKYFHNIDDPWVHHLRKPFSTMQECSTTLSGFAALIQMLDLQPGHSVVDFGCGTGWLSSALALLRCRVTGIDISRRALDIARSAVLEHPFLKRQQINFRQLEEACVPADTSSVDRIICFDSFHHVADQKLYLEEFFRILRPGGMVGFHEPGPDHSRSPGSQYEMRKYAVIENDIDLEEIYATARGIGFADMNIAAFTDTPIVLAANEFTALARWEDRRSPTIGPTGVVQRFISWASCRLRPSPPGVSYEDLGSRLFAQAKSKNVFTLRKPGTERIDSRTASTLGAQLVLIRQVLQADNRHLELSIRVHNVGIGAWLPSGQEIGAVNIGANILSAGGFAITSEPIRFQLSDVLVEPGGTVQTDLRVDLTPYIGDLIVEIDLVAEQVAWFSQTGSIPLRVSAPKSG